MEEQIYFLEESLDKTRERNKVLEQFIIGKIDTIQIKGNTYARESFTVQDGERKRTLSWGRIASWFRK